VERLRQSPLPAAHPHQAPLAIFSPASAFDRGSSEGKPGDLARQMAVTARTTRSDRTFPSGRTRGDSPLPVVYALDRGADPPRAAPPRPIDDAESSRIVREARDDLRTHGFACWTTSLTT
jgi:hypothetical protein